MISIKIECCSFVFLILVSAPNASAIPPNKVLPPWSFISDPYIPKSVAADIAAPPSFDTFPINLPIAPYFARAKFSTVFKDPSTTFQYFWKELKLAI